MKFRNGFTLIEILVTVGIIILLSGVGINNYNKFHQKRILEKTKEELKTNLRYVQGRAVNNQKPSSCSLPLDGWGISRKTSSSYRIYYRCGSSPIEEKEIVLNNINLTDFDVFFNTLGGTNLGSNITITLSDNEGNNFSILVTPAGEIN